MAYVTRTKIERVAEALSELNYVEMRKLAEVLVEITLDRDGFEFSQMELADLLADWAESQNDAYQERAKGD